MRIFWEESKFLLRSKFLWIVSLLGVALCLWAFSSRISYDQEEMNASYAFTQEQGYSFEEEDVETFIDYILDYTWEGPLYRDSLQKAGLLDLTPQEVRDYNEGKNPALTEKMNQLSEQDEATYWEVVMYMDLLCRPADLVETNSFEKGFDTEAWGQNHIENLLHPLPDWLEEKVTEAFRNLQPHVDEIVENGENHWFLPYSPFMGGNSDWFTWQFGSYGGLGFLWGVAFLVAGILAARSIGGSLMENRAGLLYSGKPGRRMALWKTVSVLAVTSVVYLFLSLLMTGIFIVWCRLDLYWNVPLASMVSYDGVTIPRFPITVGGYWLFQLGVGLGCVLIMGLIFVAFQLVTKNQYAGIALAVGFALCLIAIIQVVPGGENSLLAMSSPIGLFLNTGLFLQARFLFSVLPHFEGLSLLFWGLVASLVGGLGFLRMCRTAL